MTESHRDFARLNPMAEGKCTKLVEQNLAKRQSQLRAHREILPAPQRDNPDAPPARRHRRPPERQPRTYTTPEFSPRRRRAIGDEPPTPAELDRWDEEWRDEWDRGDVDDSAAYDEENLDVAEQSRDVEWLLDALDALDDAGDEDTFEWEE